MKVNQNVLKKVTIGLSDRSVKKVIYFIESMDTNYDLPKTQSDEYMSMIYGTKTQKEITSAFAEYQRIVIPPIVSTPAQAKKDAQRMERDYRAIAHRIPKASQTIIENLTANKYNEIR